MAFLKDIRPTHLAPFGTVWKDNAIGSHLFADSVEKIEYYFYLNPYRLQEDSEIPLLQKIELDKNTFQFGETWGWEATISEPLEEGSLLGYLIKLVKRTPGISGQEIYWIIDPYAKEATGGDVWGKPIRFRVDPDSGTLSKIEGRVDSLELTRRVPILRPSAPRKTPIKRPNHPIEKAVIMEGHVRGMTYRANLSDPTVTPGTFQSLIDKIPYYQDLGVTALELLPIFDFDETENKNMSPLTGEALYNYWGYSPILFFAVKQNYANDTQNVIEEFQVMVDAFHEAGIEIYLDVVYNHTAELDSDGPMDHFKGLSQNAWYNTYEGQLFNHSGCGNAINASHSVVKNMILQSLRYWANEMGVDGFRFDLATILDRGFSGNVNEFPHFLWEIRHDPELRNIKLIAEPWDAAGGYQVGHLAYHAHFQEWNDRYRDIIRKALRGDHGMIDQVRNCLLGSPHLYQSLSRGRYYSLNFLTAHDGMTLWDLVSYNHKQNLANGENNADGSKDNYSNNCGIEGLIVSKTIQKLRMRKVKTFFSLLLLSGGIPMMVAGDEFGRSQEGNNNAYCLDNEITWIDWRLLEKNSDLFVFVKKVIAFRKNHFDFCFSDSSHYDWFNERGDSAQFHYHDRTLMWVIHNPNYPKQQLCMLLNCFDQPLNFRFPYDSNWQVCFHSAGYGQLLIGIDYNQVQLPSFSMAVFQSNE